VTEILHDYKIKYRWNGTDVVFVSITYYCVSHTIFFSAKHNVASSALDQYRALCSSLNLLHC